VRYRAEAAFGGSSSQVVVRKPASAEFDHLYANLSFRTGAGATVALAGAVSLGGALSVAGAVTLLGPVSLPSGVIGDLAVSGTLTVNHVTVNGTLGVAGATTLGSTLAVTGGLVAQGGLVMGAPIVLTDGTVALPSLTFGGDTNTGLYRAGEGQVALASNGVAQLTANAAGVTVPTTLTASHVTLAGGILTLATGSVGAPSLTFAGATTTGIARIGVSSVSLIGNGVEALRAGGSGASPTLGFYGNTGFVKQTVSGSRAGNAALQSLLTALATIGLIGDASS
jgi:hypothetical protein